MPKTRKRWKGFWREALIGAVEAGGRASLGPKLCRELPDSDVQFAVRVYNVAWWVLLGAWICASVVISEFWERPWWLALVMGFALGFANLHCAKLITLWALKRVIHTRLEALKAENARLEAMWRES